MVPILPIDPDFGTTREQLGLPRDGHSSQTFKRLFRIEWNRRIAELHQRLDMARQAEIQGEHEWAGELRAQAVLLEERIRCKWPAHFRQHGTARLPVPTLPRFNRRRG